jgi:hypothetical protein
MGQGMGVGEIVNSANAFHVALRHGAKHVASDAPEAVDAVICHKITFGLRLPTNSFVSNSEAGKINAYEGEAMAKWLQSALHV